VGGASSGPARQRSLFRSPMQALRSAVVQPVCQVARSGRQARCDRIHRSVLVPALATPPGAAGLFSGPAPAAHGGPACARGPLSGSAPAARCTPGWVPRAGLGPTEVRHSCSDGVRSGDELHAKIGVFPTPSWKDTGSVRPELVARLLPKHKFDDVEAEMLAAIQRSATSKCSTRMSV